MAAAQMAAWCRDHRRVSPACLPGYRLAFLRDSPRWLAGAADLARSPRGAVWGVLWEVSERDLAALDVKEYLSGSGYRRLEVEVRTAGGSTRRAITYEVVRKSRRELEPLPRYLDLMLAGAREARLPRHYVAGLERLRGRAIRSRLGPGGSRHRPG